MNTILTPPLKSLKAASFLFSVLFLLFSAASCSDDSSGGFTKKPTDPVETEEGYVIGMNEGDMYTFRGIPYAAPPVGELRFAPPQPAPDRGEEIFEALSFGNICPQISYLKAMIGNEDCLTLNIFTPGGNIVDLPVMVWIHGGALIMGSSSGPVFDKPGLVAENVIVVTINYRLGALGFLTHESLTEEQEQSGNYGIMDQQRALMWVRDNIQNFGGDPTNITIFGQSAGGHSVLTHLAAPGSAGLFHKAIVQSGSYSPHQISKDAAYGLFGDPFEDRSGCSTEADIPACFRSLTVEEVLDAQGFMNWYVPVTGYNFLPGSIADTLDTGTFHKVPVLIGGTMDEGTLFVALDLLLGKGHTNEETYTEAVTDLLKSDQRNIDFNTVANDYISDYEPDNPDRFRIALSRVWTDYMFNSGKAVHWDRLSLETDTYAYWFTDVNAPFHPASMESLLRYLGHDDFIPLLGASHSFDVQYVSGNFDSRNVTSQQISLSDTMISFWAQFAKTGDPGGGWSSYDPINGKFVMELNTPGPSAADSDEFKTYHNYDYWINPPLVE